MVLTARDTLDTTTARETADGRLGDALNVVAKNLAVALGAALPKALATLAATSHDESVGGSVEVVVVIVLLMEKKSFTRRLWRG
jgi:hypothetical protein